MQKLKIEITTWSVVKVVLVLLALYFVFFIRDIIALLFVVLILVAAFNPVVSKWEKKIGRTFAVLALVLLAILLISIFVMMIVPPLITQTRNLIAGLPAYFENIEFLRSYVPVIKENISSITSSLGNITGSIFSVTASVFGGVVTFFTAIILTIYLLLDKKALSHTAYSLLPADIRGSVSSITKKIALKVGDWFRGQLVLAGIIGLLSYIGLLIIGVPYALTLALIAGLLEIVPTIGPIIAGIIAILVAFLDEPYKALIVLIFYIILQQLENNILVPKIMQKALGISPVIIILAILVGAKLLGVIGAILAVPIAGALFVLVQEWPKVREITGK